MGWFAWPEYSCSGVCDKAFILVFIIDSRKQAEVGIPSFVLPFQCRMSPQVFKFSYMSQKLSVLDNCCQIHEYSKSFS